MQIFKAKNNITCRTIIDELYDEVNDFNKFSYSSWHIYLYDTLPSTYVIKSLDTIKEIRIKFGLFGTPVTLEYSKVTMNKKNLSRENYKKLQFVARKIIKDYKLMKQVFVDAILLGLGEVNTPDKRDAIYRFMAERNIEKLTNMSDEDLVALKLRYS